MKQTETEEGDMKGMKGQFRKVRPGIVRRIAIALAAIVCVCVTSSGWGASNVMAGSPNPKVPEATCPAGGQCFADVTSGNPFYAFINRIYQQDLVTGYPCGGPGEPC